MVRDINPGSVGTAFGTSAIFDGRLYFEADDAVYGMELWRTDGSADGTVLVADLMPGADNGNPTNFCVSGGRLFFTALSPEMGRELWAMNKEVRGDINGDGCVDLSDLAALLANYGQIGPHLPGDLNADGVVDLSDLELIISNYGSGC